MRVNKTALLLAIAILAVSASAAHSQIVGKPEGTVIERAGITPNLGEKLPLDLEFVDASGKTIRLQDCFTDRPVILHLVYYECPMLCKLSSDGLFATLSTLSLRLGEDFTVVTLSFDPTEKSELSAAARQVAVERCGQQAVEQGWHFLTGESTEIEAITKSVGFKQAYDEQTRQYAHASGLFVLTPDGTVSRFLGGINYPPRDLRLSIVEASNGKVGTAGDQVMLLCYMYDPTTGRYGIAVMTMLRAAAVLTVGTLATSILTMVRRERKRNAKFAMVDEALITNSEKV